MKIRATYSVCCRILREGHQTNDGVMHTGMCAMGGGDRRPVIYLVDYAEAKSEAEYLSKQLVDAEFRNQGIIDRLRHG